VGGRMLLGSEPRSYFLLITADLPSALRSLGDGHSESGGSQRATRWDRCRIVANPEVGTLRIAKCLKNRVLNMDSPPPLRKRRVRFRCGLHAGIRPCWGV
jgi:hypothetical protein